jgi:hypothetical protein
MDVVTGWVHMKISPPLWNKGHSLKPKVKVVKRAMIMMKKKQRP